MGGGQGRLCRLAGCMVPFPCGFTIFCFVFVFSSLLPFFSCAFLLSWEGGIEKKDGEGRKGFTTDIRRGQGRGGEGEGKTVVLPSDMRRAGASSSCSALTASCSCSERISWSASDGGCSCCRGVGQLSSSPSCCSCSFCSSSNCWCCSCSVYPSCYYSQDISPSHASSRSRDCSTFYTFQEDIPMEVPQLLRFSNVPPSSSVAAGPTERRLGSDVVPAALSPPPLPHAVSPTGTGAKRSTVATQTEESAHAETTRRAYSPQQRSIGTWTAPGKNTRATSPVPTVLLDAANNTEISGAQWEGQSHELLHKTTLLQEQLYRNNFLETRQISMELAFTSTQERIKQSEERHKAAISYLTAAREEHRQELERLELTCRQSLFDHEVELRSMLLTLLESWRSATLSAEQTRNGHEQFLRAARGFSQFEDNIFRQLLLDEVRHREEVKDSECQFRLALRQLRELMENCQRESSRTTAAINVAEEEKRAAIMAKAAVEEKLRDVLEREKELRLQYLHVLRLPTTTIVSCSHHSNATTSVEDDIPVHARFVRAHKEAVDAVRAQRRHTVGQLHIF
ncbi:hypothetical protein MOQ_000658 [Trypanosoma cruzi marinkellei]|uniref:Uncharacterized protein n=1 Tax=Trypanosoma cruzi marinkellei TaxID=85056 RepID=K2MV93_TRYCR|nr:hypothetical protein MOQ_000658 [Trypanosoma cruzi marinkellei]